jgi:hypothetical protein
MGLETNIHGIWAAKQSALGTPAAAPTTLTTGKRFRLAAQGGVGTNIEMGSEAFNDLDQFGDAQDYIQSIIGGGAPPFMGTPNELAWLAWMFNGAETVTNIPGPPVAEEHVSTPATSLFYSTFFQRTGSSIIERVQHNDCVINGLEITAGTGQHVLRVTPTIISLDPGVIIAADPTLAMPLFDSFLWTEAEGALLLGGVVMTGPTQYTLTLSKNLEANYADGVTPEDLQPATPTIGVSMAMLLKQQEFEFARNLIYASGTPAPGAKPARFLGGMSSFAVTHTQKDSAGVATGKSAKFEVPGVRWDKPSAIAVPNPGGGGGTLELSGGMRKVAGQPAWRSTVRCSQVAFTA